MNWRMQSPGRHRSSEYRALGFGLWALGSGLWALGSENSDRLDFDHPVRMSERRHFDERRGRTLLPQILGPDRRKIDAIGHVRQVGRDLDDVGHRPALRLDERFDRRVRTARLGFEIAAVRRTAIGLVRDLAREEEDGLRLADLDALTVSGRLEHTGCAELFDCDHWCSLAGPKGPALHGNRRARPFGRAIFIVLTECRRRADPSLRAARASVHRRRPENMTR